MLDVQIPCPLLVTVDDVGWWLGWDGSACNQPFRTGMQRFHVPEDYQALAVLGRALEMRIPAGLVLCEWDSTNLLSALPSATWMGDQWQAPFHDQAQKESAVSILKDAGSFIEPALHGVGHEFWLDGKLSRSEFHTEQGMMRHPDEVKKHLEYFFRLLEENHFGTGVRLFIPPAMNHAFGSGESGFQEIAGSFGIRYVSLDLNRARCHVPPQYMEAGWENGVVLMDRGKSPITWSKIAAPPVLNPDQAILPLHWANVLHEKPEKNLAVVKAWIKFIDREISENNMVPARDIAQCLTQFLNYTQSRIEKRGKHVTIFMDWIHKVPNVALSDSVFFSVSHSPKYRLDI